MTRDEAYQAMREGKKVIHKYFDDHEYLCMKCGVILSEEGYNFEEGWKIRKGGFWETDWFVKS
jgi:transcription initiation factor TFIIIB Brf1 subunit/transcription initiation factor TFIIB